MRKRSFFALLTLLFLGTLFAQEILNNDSVIKLVRSGLSEDLVVSIVKNQPGKYTLNAEDIISLKNVGVSEKIISAMLAKATTEPDLPKQLGIYWRKRGNWIQVMPEVINWQTGGALKHVGTLGIVKGDVNGRVYGEHSQTNVGTPTEFLFRLPEGTEITEYQLLRLHEHGKAREFRTVTGGVFHASGGGTRDLIPFDFKRIADQTFAVSLSDMKVGEYGFLAPGAALSSHASAQLGKIYSFRVGE
jgi:hypothetical protein